MNTVDLQEALKAAIVDYNAEAMRLRGSSVKADPSKVIAAERALLDFAAESSTTPFADFFETGFGALNE